MEQPLPDRTPGLAYATKLRWVRSSISSIRSLPPGGRRVLRHGHALAATTGPIRAGKAAPTKCNEGERVAGEGGALVTTTRRSASPYRSIPSKLAPKRPTCLSEASSQAVQAESTCPGEGTAS